MSETKIHERASGDEASIAEQLVRARLEARVLTQYPGDFPAGFAAAYRCQNAGIALWPEPIGGWKVSMFLPPEQQALCGAERLVGPAFLSSILTAAAGQVVDCPLIAGAVSGVEPEVVIRVGRDAPPDKLNWTAEEASEMVGEMFIGVEVVSSSLSLSAFPTGQAQLLATIIADFGINAGIVVGRSIPEWRALKEIAVQVFIDGEFTARGVSSLRDGPLGGLAFALSRCARNGHPLRAGAMIASGTLTGGLHHLKPGQSTRLMFEGLGEVLCRAVQAAPHPQTQASR